jgi:hypothetical protein
LYSAVLFDCYKNILVFPLAQLYAAESNMCRRKMVRFL